MRAILIALRYAKDIFDKIKGSFRANQDIDKSNTQARLYGQEKEQLYDSRNVMPFG